MEFYGIQCVEGELKGAEVPMEHGQIIVIGRDAGEANLVFRDSTISRKHLLVELDDGDYYVTDYSRVGTETEDGIRFEQEIRTQVAAGTVLVIGKAGTKVKLI